MIRKLIFVPVVVVACLTLLPHDSLAARQPDYSRVSEEIVISNKAVLVREVRFANQESGYAITQIYVDDENGSHYDLADYHPEFTVGLHAEVARVYLRNSPNPGHYANRFCVNYDEQKSLFCIYQR